MRNKLSMKRIIISLAIGCLGTTMVEAQLSFSNIQLKAIEIQPDVQSGLEQLYVIRKAQGAKASYSTSTGTHPKWYRFSNLGGAYAEEITDVSYDGPVSSIEISPSDMGYIVEDGGRQHCYWIVNYADHELDIQSLSITTESDCDRTSLQPQGKGDAIYYYTINGRRIELSRELKVSYRTLKYSADTESYAEATVDESFPYLMSTLHVTAPLTDTQFILSGDRFLKEWNIEQEVISESFNTTSVEATTIVSQVQTDYDNEQKDSEVSGLGGSAPCDITFRAIVTDAVVFKEWQFSRTNDFDVIDDRYNQDEVSHTFTENGTTYARFVAANADGSCTWESDVYTISIGESRLECPNAFSPENQDGVNDLWKVSYKSIISFECNIFNRWGKKLCTLTHPSQGWDGKIGNKFVPSGVYFYVIKARGADGKNYNLAGDINIINSRVNPNPGTSSGE